jgi:hypothetical protein
VLALAAACDRLGNPPNPAGTTLPATTAVGALQLVTQAHSAPAGSRAALLRRHPVPRQFEDRTAPPPDGVHTLVVVRLAGATHLGGPVLVLRTTFTFHDRTPISRTWLARGNTVDVRALFSLPASPRTATTTLGS